MSTIPNGWLQKDSYLTAIYECDNFTSALKLLNKIAELAESQNHHPDIAIKNYKEVHVSTTTHSANAITDKDYDMANAISDIYNQHK